MKKCNSCNEELPVESFHARKASPDGLSYRCKECVRQYDAAHRLANKDRLQEFDRKRYAENSERKKEMARAYYRSNAERIRAYDKARKPGRYRAARAAYASYGAARRASIESATPCWADAARIKEIYEFAQEFREHGFDVHVDHIVPLKAKIACGLHVAENLRVCLASVNLQKWNSYELSDE